MGKKVPEFLIYFLEDCLYGDPAYTYKSMFGGYGIYKNRKIFAILVSSGELYFKVGDSNRKDYVDAGSSQFEYSKQGKKVHLCYYLLPEEILENHDLLEQWIDHSLEISLKQNRIKPVNKIDKEILEHLLTIPKGKVMTYKTLGLKFGVHPRKVAAVMKYNKQPYVYPCYKVISHSGLLSGYNTSRGIEEKIEKLQNDGVEVLNGKIDKKFII